MSSPNRNFGIAIAVLSISLPQATFAQVGAVMHGSRGYVGKLIAGGHSGVYFANICADGIKKLRKCNPGEMGSVMARYSGWGQGPDGKKVDSDWGVVPFNVHFFGVETREEIPLVVTPQISDQIKEAYRRKYLSETIRAPQEGERSSPGNWQTMLGTAYVRGADILIMETSPGEDQLLIDSYNKDPNHAKFNFFISNCADLQKEVLGKVFPNTMRRSPKDFMMSSPISNLHGLDNYGKDHPERLLRFTSIQQLPGSIAFDGPVRSGMDNAWKQPRYAIPLVLAPHYGATFVALSMINRFNPDKERKKNPSLEVAKLKLDLYELEKKKADIEKSRKDCANCHPLDSIQAEMTQLETSIEGLRGEIDKTIETLALKDEDAFQDYRKKFSAVIGQALEKHLITPLQAYQLRTGAPQKYLKEFEGKEFKVKMDPVRGLILTQTKDGVSRSAGLSAKNIESEDKNLGFQLILGAINYRLEVSMHDRDTLDELEKDWGIMARLGISLGLAL